MNNKATFKQHGSMFQHRASKFQVKHYEATCSRKKAALLLDHAKMHLQSRDSTISRNKERGQREPLQKKGGKKSKNTCFQSIIGGPQIYLLFAQFFGTGRGGGLKHSHYSVTWATELKWSILTHTAHTSYTFYVPRRDQERRDTCATHFSYFQFMLNLQHTTETLQCTHT